MTQALPIVLFVIAAFVAGWFARGSWERESRIEPPGEALADEARAALALAEAAARPGADDRALDALRAQADLLEDLDDRLRAEGPTAPAVDDLDDLLNALAGLLRVLARTEAPDPGAVGRLLANARTAVAGLV